jgi:hypothetical protein
VDIVTTLRPDDPRICGSIPDTKVQTSCVPHAVSYRTGTCVSYLGDKVAGVGRGAEDDYCTSSNSEVKNACTLS